MKSNMVTVASDEFDTVFFEPIFSFRAYAGSAFKTWKSTEVSNRENTCFTFTKTSYGFSGHRLGWPKE